MENIKKYKFYFISLAVTISVILVCISLVLDTNTESLQTEDVNIDSLEEELAHLSPARQPRPSATKPTVEEEKEEAKTERVSEANEALNYEVAVKRVSMDKIREESGLPPVMNNLMHARNFRRPTQAELHDPILNELYLLDSKIHEVFWLVRHQRQEARRFLAEAAKAKSSESKEFLTIAAYEHEQLAKRYEKELARLRKERAELI